MVLLSLKKVALVALLSPWMLLVVNGGDVVDQQEKTLLRKEQQNYNEEDNNEHRSLKVSTNQVFALSQAFCHSSGGGAFETVATIWPFGLWHRLHGDAVGICGDICTDLCSHKACVDDFTAGTDGWTCQCISGQETYCGSNTFCDNDECFCNQGYQGTAQSEAGCSDIDECASNICGPGTCTNTIGSYICECNPGYRWSGAYGASCQNINECAEGTPCGPNAICTDTDGGFSCVCAAGYQGNPPSVQCGDVDECQSAPCGPQGTCVNQDGSFTCNCNAGYVWPNRNSQCVDYNECLDEPCGENEFCTNTIGDFTCSCVNGYTGNPAAGVPCVDENECANPEAACGPNSICTNVPGAVECACRPDFPGGNPPAEPCRKLSQFEECESVDASFTCESGSICARETRSADSSTLRCCSDYGRCFTDQNCCNGYLQEGNSCPSGNDDDCAGDLTCTATGPFTSETICCRRTNFLGYCAVF